MDEALLLKVYSDIERQMADIDVRQGLPGEKGEDGKDGLDGKDGKDGADGKDGKDGKDGLDGKDGQDGKDGEDGDNGVSIIDVSIDLDQHLVTTLSNGETIDAGELSDFTSQTQIVTKSGGTGSGFDSDGDYTNDNYTLEATSGGMAIKANSALGNVQVWTGVNHSLSFFQFFTVDLIYAYGAGGLLFSSSASDVAGRSVVTFQSFNALTAAGTKIAKFQNGTVEKCHFDKDGNINSEAGLGLHGKTAPAKHNTTGNTTGFSAGTGTACNSDSTWDGSTGSTGYTVGDIVTALKAIGILDD